MLESPRPRTPGVAAHYHQDRQAIGQDESEKEQVTPREVAKESKAPVAMPESTRLIKMEEDSKASTVIEENQNRVTGQSHQLQQPEGQDKKDPVNIVVKKMSLKGSTYLREKKITTTSIEIQERNRLAMPPPPDKDEDVEPLNACVAEYFLETVIAKFYETGMNPFDEGSTIKELMNSMDLKCSVRCFRRQIRQSIELYEQSPWTFEDPNPLRDEIIFHLKNCLYYWKGSVERDISPQDMKAKDVMEEEEKKMATSPQQNTFAEKKRPLVGVKIQEKHPKQKQMKKTSGEEHPYLNKLLKDMNFHIPFFKGILDYRAANGVFPFDYEYALQDFIRNWLEIDLQPVSLIRVIRSIRDEYYRMNITWIVQTLRFWEPPAREAFDLANRIWGIYTEPLYRDCTSGTKLIDDDSLFSSSSESTDNERWNPNTLYLLASIAAQNTSPTSIMKPVDPDEMSIQEEEDSDEEPLTIGLAQFYLEEVLQRFCDTGINPLDEESTLRDLITWLECGNSMGQMKGLIKRSLEMYDEKPWDIEITHPLKDEKLLELKNRYLFTTEKNVDRDASQQKTESRYKKEAE